MIGLHLGGEYSFEDGLCFDADADVEYGLWRFEASLSPYDHRRFRLLRASTKVQIELVKPIIELVDRRFRLLRASTKVQIELVKPIIELVDRRFCLLRASPKVQG